MPDCGAAAALCWRALAKTPRQSTRPPGQSPFSMPHFTLALLNDEPEAVRLRSLLAQQGPGFTELVHLPAHQGPPGWPTPATRCSTSWTR
jgi:hypothetical protein